MDRLFDLSSLHKGFMLTAATVVTGWLDGQEVLSLWKGLYDFRCEEKVLQRCLREKGQQIKIE
jgi:hypothetical protein